MGEPQSKYLISKPFLLSFVYTNSRTQTHRVGGYWLGNSHEIRIRSISDKPCSSNSLFSWRRWLHFRFDNARTESQTIVIFIPLRHLTHRCTKLHQRLLNRYQKFQKKEKKRESNQGEKVVQLSNFFFIIPPSHPMVLSSSVLRSNWWKSLDVCQQTTLDKTREFRLRLVAMVRGF